MELQEEMIQTFSTVQLLNQDTLYNLYDIDDELERARLRALLMVRAKALKMEKRVCRCNKSF